MLHCLPFVEVHSLDNTKFPWLPRINGLSLLAAVDTIRRTLQATQKPKERLQRVATLYSWIVPRGIFSPWFLYRFNENLVGLKPTDVMLMVVKMMESLAGHLPHGYCDNGEALFFSVMARDLAYGAVEHSLVCFCIWHGLPYLAVHAPPVMFQQTTLSATLMLISHDPQKWVSGIYEKLSSAHTAIL